MPEQGPSASARMAAAFETLRESAKEINAVSDELSRSIETLERAFARLKLRVATWTKIADNRGGDGDRYHREYVGYIEHQGEWCIALSTNDGSDGFPEDEVERIWAFDEAPQYLRIKAIDKLPDLVEALVVTVNKTTERMKKKVGDAQEIASTAQTLSIKKKVTP